MKFSGFIKSSLLISVMLCISNVFAKEIIIKCPITTVKTLKEDNTRVITEAGSSKARYWPSDIAPPAGKQYFLWTLHIYGAKSIMIRDQSRSDMPDSDGRSYVAENYIDNNGHEVLSCTGSARDGDDTGNRVKYRYYLPNPELAKVCKLDHEIGGAKGFVCSDGGGAVGYW